MKAPVDYWDNICDESMSLDMVNALIHWEQRETARAEAFMSNPPGVAYTYGKANFERVYVSVAMPQAIEDLLARVNSLLGSSLDVCFANRYDSEINHVGWHKDDSVDIDQTQPIAVVSLGAAREIWFRDNVTSEVDKLLLPNGSLAVMRPGMQSTHMHRIPKHSARCGMRVSLTMRAMKKGT